MTDHNCYEQCPSEVAAGRPDRCGVFPQICHIRQDGTAICYLYEHRANRQLRTFGTTQRRPADPAHNPKNPK